ncbi:hypothetical protein PC116_g4795 [Phytophthora cactorum]|nr:hypothetical protein PC114_g15243 [Phytophthora cactorum]KAG3131786.1 hypothetical protein C6341_g23193 [Phytophthora cactorum]KAG3203513.1 hypothetical protein PC128_g2574 [Phytophthora cactorum]KAG4042632.1 hypothetical protein PC123_g21883 [Phytophthora cactorum]KAG4247445.1 hypothetical protein PC116_g4795 [Phytophthora cactorum]
MTYLLQLEYNAGAPQRLLTSSRSLHRRPRMIRQACCLFGQSMGMGLSPSARE